MIKAYVVVYVFSNILGTSIKRKRFPASLKGLSDARNKFMKGKKYIELSQSEDFESITLYADTSNNGMVLIRSWDTAFGWRYGNPMEVYADG